MPDNRFQVTHALWLKTESARLEAFLLMPRCWGTQWTAPMLQKTLGDIGLHYSQPQLQEIGADLLARGIIVAVQE